MVLVSAPAGFGKTTMLADWVAAAPTAAWVSLEQADNHATTFWRYVAESLRRAVPSTSSASALLEDGDLPPVASSLAALVNDLDAAETEVTLVLDDYHVIDDLEIHEQVSWLIEHLPPGARIAIATRADPPFPLARLRAKRELVEIRAADLRFTTDEAATYLNELMSLDLAPDDVAALDDRTEGWIAALQLAALSLQGRADAAGFIADFAGDDRYIVDYLVQEVLQRQPDDIRAFLLDTSILDRMTGDLCDAVTGLDSGAATLEALERANMFVIPLDARRGWYRYHHLFADVLRSRLSEERRGVVEELHRRASEWFERHDDRDSAIEHALAARNWDRAAYLLELALPQLRRGRQEMTMRRWFGALPGDVFRNRPVLSVGYVGALMSNGDIQDIDTLLTDAERWLDPMARLSDMVVVDEAELARLPSAVAMYRAGQAQLRGDVHATLSHAHRALELADVNDPLGRGGAAGLLALAHWSSGDLEGAYAYWTDAMASLQRAGHTVDAIAIVRALGEIRFAQGRLSDVRQAYKRGLEMAQGDEGPKRGLADMHAGLAELALETGDLDAAAEHLQSSTDLDERGLGLPQNASRRRIVAALLRAAEGDAVAALGLLDEAERAFVGEYFPVVRPIPALRARMQLAAGRLKAAADLVAERGLSTDDDLEYLHEYEHVTLARLLLASGEHGPAVALLDRLLASAESGGRGRTVVEVLVLLALAHRAARDEARALTAVRRALAVAEPEASMQVFLGEGAPVTAMLEAAIAHGIHAEYARRLLAASEVPRKQPLADPLSQREVEVLRLLATDLGGPEIADELVVGLSTVRSHTKSIYAKLGVNSRRAAVRRGEELGLMAGTSRR